MTAGGGERGGGPGAPGEVPSADHRRTRSALFLVGCVVAGLAPHALPASRTLWPAVGLTLLLGAYTVVSVLAQLAGGPAPSASTDVAAPLPDLDVVVAARDEQAVILRLVERLSRLRYRPGGLKLWVVDDGSEDRTGELLEEQARRLPMLQVVRRPRDAGGGKSGALNTVMERLRGRWMLVLDADAQLQDDLLERLIPFAEQGGWAAVQLRKAVCNAGENLLTRAQAMEMALDALIQEGRLASGGVAELRGNGQLLRREAVLACGGFNEETVTDDLDLSFRLLLAGQPVGILWDPPVQEEAVLSLRALWRQRQRWAEGGLQRFFDYWGGLVSSRLSGRQRLDLACFFLLQYALPVAAVADLAGSLASGTPPTLWPLSLVAFSLSGVTFLMATRRSAEGPALPAMTPFNLALGIVYLGHWFVVIPWTTLRMVLLPKRLVWAKTLHLGSESQGTAAEPGSGAGDASIDPLVVLEDGDLEDADLSTQIG